MPSRSWIVSLVILVAAGTVAGCGGGGGSEQVSAAELVQRADAICGRERGSFDRIQTHAPPNASIAADQTDELIRVTEDANSQLRELKPPDGLQAAYDRYLAARDRVVEVMKRGKDAADDRNSAAYGAAQADVARTAPDRRRLARSLHFKVCSSSAATA